MKKTALIDRDGVLIWEPPDTHQIDSMDLLKILPGVMDGLKRLAQEGYRLVMVTNQDGLGTKKFPQKNFEGPQKRLLETLKRSGISFEQVFICPHFSKDRCACRKPKIGLVKAWMAREPLDPVKSFMVGDRETDEQFAKNLGLRTVRVATNSRFPRMATVDRRTRETSVFTQVNLDGRGEYYINTGVKFFDHMLEQLSRHSLIDLTVDVVGDLHVDEHHTVEDVGLTIGEAVAKALGSRRGIRRYGFLLPMDDALVEAALDLGGRPYCVFHGKFKREKVGDLPTELVEHFFKSLSDALKANVHITVRYSRNEHHAIEASFKVFAKALRMACEADPRAVGQLPTTKGLI